MKKSSKIKQKPNSKGMKSYASFDLYLADQSLINQKIIKAIRKFVNHTAPYLKEVVKWGNGCWVKDTDKIPVTGVYADKDHIQFLFMRGSSIKDPKKLLQGKGQYVRHIKVYKISDINKKYFSNLLKQSIKLAK